MNHWDYIHILKYVLQLKVYDTNQLYAIVFGNEVFIRDSAYRIITRLRFILILLSGDLRFSSWI